MRARGNEPSPPYAPGYAIISLPFHNLCSFPACFWAARGQSMLYVAHVVGEAWQFSAAWSCHDDLQARGPALLAPGGPPEDVDTHCSLAALPHPPQCPAPCPLQASPVCPQPPSRSPLHHQGLQHLPQPPDCRPRTACFGASLPSIQHALPPFYRALHWPSHPGQRADGRGPAQGGSHSGADEDPAGPKPRRVFGRTAVLPPLPLETLSGRGGLLLRQPLRLDRAVHHCGTRGRLPMDGAGAARCPRLRASDGPAIHALSVPLLEG
jgi:hypothetical protein